MISPTRSGQGVIHSINVMGTAFVITVGVSAIALTAMDRLTTWSSLPLTTSTPTALQKLGSFETASRILMISHTVRLVTLSI